jgi:Cu-Zn family superoxide dismutase
MAMRTLTAAATSLLLVACAGPHGAHGPQGATGGPGGTAMRGMPDGAMAMARLEATRGNTASGTAMFHQRGDMVMLHVRVQGLKPGQEHGFHIHDKGDCSSGDGMSTGGHFNPGAKPHARHDAPERHAGDLPSLKADAAGRVDVHLQLAGLSIGSGAANIVGRGLIVHADPDDYRTQPTGNAGARIACGVIEAQRG